MRLAVVIPVYGQEHFTNSVLEDLNSERHLCDIWVVDNLGSYKSRYKHVRILRPRMNLKWAGGCNFGIGEAIPFGYDYFLLLNNDTILSPGFISGLLSAAEAVGAEIVGPCYDHNWSHQRSGYLSDARNYVGREVEHKVPFIDGTCMLIRSSVFDRIGFLDDETWPGYEWGCDKDLALRVRGYGGAVWVTRRAYLNHIARGTVRCSFEYSETAAELENDSGMSRKWGVDWREKLFKGFPDVPTEGMVQERLRGWLT
jgi:GT2 family glycosyltransferase